MTFSKSFGYAVRGVLYIAVMQEERRFVQVEEMAACMGIPRYFMAKTLKKLVKEKVLSSVKGPAGGFALHPETLKLPLMRLMEITDGLDLFQTCVLRLTACTATRPCPMHHQMEGVNSGLKRILSQTTLGDLMKGEKSDFLDSLSPAMAGDPSVKQKKYKRTIHARPSKPA